jgi:tetratricopeptide (TPR) repeat protein
VVYFNLGRDYEDLGKYQRAIQDYTEAIQAGPDYAIAYNSRDLTYRALGQFLFANADDARACSWDSQYC